MAGFASLLLKPILDASLAGTAAKGTMGMNKKEATKPILDDGFLSVSEGKGTKAKDPEYKTLSKDQINDLVLMLTIGGLSPKEATKIATSGYISEEQLKKLSPDAIKEIEGLTGIPMTFPEPEKSGGTPPITGTSMKKTTRTEMPDGEVTEKTETFDSNSGIKKSSRTEIPELDLSELFPNVEFISPEDIRADSPYVKTTARVMGISPEEVVRMARARLRTNESLRGGKSERKAQSRKVTDQLGSLHGRTVEVDEKDIMPSHLTKGEQNVARHEAQKRLNEAKLREEELAKKNLLNND